MAGLTEAQDQTAAGDNWGALLVGGALTAAAAAPPGGGRILEVLRLSPPVAKGVLAGNLVRQIPAA